MRVRFCGRLSGLMQVSHPVPTRLIAEQNNMLDPIDGAGEALRRFRMRQGLVELVERPIYFVAGDHQWGTDTDGVVVGVLT